MIKLVLILFLILPFTSSFANFKFRAREHFDLHSLSANGHTSKYSGLSNTVTFGHEVKAKHYYGLYFNPVLASMAELKDSSSPFAKKIRLLSLGLTAKNFYPWSGDFFSRIALGWSQLTSDQQTKRNGFSGYAAVGYEWFFNKSYSLAPELGYRQSSLQNNVELKTITFSLAFHIYRL